MGPSSKVSVSSCSIGLVLLVYSLAAPTEGMRISLESLNP
jgi:hypothetical protein